MMYEISKKENTNSDEVSVIFSSLNLTIKQQQYNVVLKSSQKVNPPRPISEMQIDAPQKRLFFLLGINDSHSR
jgi:hypothetical protein